MTVESLAVTIVAFVAAAAAVLAVGLLLRDRRRAAAEFDRRAGNGIPQVEPIPTDVLVRTTTSDFDRRFYLLLEGAGSNLSPEAALALVAGLAVVACATTLVFTENFLAGIAGLLLGFVLPLGWWVFCRARRLRQFQTGLPAALDLVADSLRAGQTLEQAMEIVAAQSATPFKEEFGFCLALLRMGHVPTVMDRLARRIPLPEFKVFATAVIVHRQTGGNLAKLVSRLARSARDRQEFIGHLWAQSVAARYSAAGLALTVLVGLLIVGGTRPEYIGSFVSQPHGLVLLATAAALFTLGTLWMWRILKVRY